jgi:hypothetical protein
MWRQMSVGTLFAWMLWMDQTVYSVPSPGDTTPRQLESARTRWAQLAVTSTRAECESLRTVRVQDATKREAALDAASGRKVRYREQFRYFCSPLGEVGR